ncbi:MAG: CoB--CoM heterodisulfide reductase iron-sulfur subunit A family protein [Desulfamplus sp.]|nr:CoB--CoM heterodisulfide reductase iron-sulfur subunit A family protein [Desulfamplus sp.]
MTDITGQAGDFHVHLTRYPRYVDMEKCIACGLCAEKCPKKVNDPYEEGISKRKAIYVKYAQAVPLKYAIDDAHCIYLTRGKCGVCKKVCPTDAVNYEDKKENLILKVGSVIIAAGCTAYDPSGHDIFNYSGSPNIVTSIEFERILSSSGPCQGHVVRPSDQKTPKKIAWLQCVGSRDNHIGSYAYCSSVCCTYAIKEAMLAKEHVGGDLDTAIFYMDIRTHGKDYEDFYNRGRSAGIRFVKSRINRINTDPASGMNLILYIDENGERQEEQFDLVVLSVGLCVGKDGIDLARRVGFDLDGYNFAVTSSFEPVKTSKPGIYICGSFEAPKDIPSSVTESSAAAGMAGINLMDARWSLTRTKEIPQEINVTGEAPRIGVFVCRCGTNIAGVVDVPAVVEMAKGLPYVELAQESMFACSQDAQDAISGIIKEKNLNRVVIAACTPKTHEPLFQETLVNAGINKYLFEMANIRNHCSWVHASNKDLATEKAKDLVRMSTAKAVLHEPLDEPSLNIDQSALVIGGGVAGMVAALTLAAQGYMTHLVERTGRLGGIAGRLHRTWQGEDIRHYVRTAIQRVNSNPLVKIHLDSQINHVDGFVGNFSTHILKDGRPLTIEHGVTVIATGALEFKPGGYLLGETHQVITGLEMDEILLGESPSIPLSDISKIKSAVFLQCAGSRVPGRVYCSKVCCTQSIRNALELKSMNPSMDVYILYRDMRPFGLREDIYRKAREQGVKFLRFRHGNKNPAQEGHGNKNPAQEGHGNKIPVQEGHGNKSPVQEGHGNKIPVQEGHGNKIQAQEVSGEGGVSVRKSGAKLETLFFETSLQRRMKIEADLLILASGVVPERENRLSALYKIPRSQDGFFMEAHAKLRPVDCSTDGVFLCGLAHGPKPIDESIAQAQAAATRAVTLLAKKTMRTNGNVARVQAGQCSSCGICVSVCPYSAPSFIKEGRFKEKAEINPVLCKGCGLCVASCRSGAIHLNGFDNSQIFAQLFSLNDMERG